MKAVYRAISSVLWIGILFALVIIGAVKLTNQDWARSPFRAYVIISSSMEPKINVGDIAIVQKGAAYDVGSVITFTNQDGVLVTHRIIDNTLIEGVRHLITQGDNVDDPDADPVPESVVIGKVVSKAPFLGFMVVYSQTPLGMGIILGVFSILLITDSFILGSKKAIEKKKPSEPEEEVPAERTKSRFRTQTSQEKNPPAFKSRTISLDSEEIWDEEDEEEDSTSDEDTVELTYTTAHVPKVIRKNSTSVPSSTEVRRLAVDEEDG